MWAATMTVGPVPGADADDVAHRVDAHLVHQRLQLVAQQSGHLVLVAGEAVGVGELGEQGG